jgi:CTP:molybdopterin cytidylyltransferase MocA
VLKKKKTKMTRPTDTVVLAGTHRHKKRLVVGKNKAFLELKGRPLIVHVTQSCLECSQIGKVIVVGPRNALESSLEELSAKYPERLMIIQQRSRMLENVWNGFLASFDDGNNLPVNRRIETLLLGGIYPIKKKAHLNIVLSVYSAVAGAMIRTGEDMLEKESVVKAMEQRFNEFRRRFERQERFMTRMNVETLLSDGHILLETETGICFRETFLFEFFAEWEKRFKKQIFIIGCDVPLITSEAVADFVDRCDSVPGDFHVSVASHSLLKCFYKDKNGNEGIQRPYMSMNEAHIRAANMMLVRPNRVGNKELIQQSFGIRKMTEWRNVFALFWILLRLSGRFQTVRMGILLQMAAIVRRLGMHSLNDRIRKRIRVEDFEELLSRTFMTGFRLVETPYAAVSLDIDTEDDYRKICQNLDYWSEIQRQIMKNIPCNSVNEGRLIGIFSDIFSDKSVQSNESSKASTTQ